MFDAAELQQWAETYGHPEEWAKRAQDAHARAERLEAKCIRYLELLTEALEFTERHVSIDSPWTRDARLALGLPSAASGDPVARETTPPTAELEQIEETS